MDRKRITFFLDTPHVPGEEAVDGIRFDFCDGCRILFPYGLGEHDVVLLDNDTGEIVQETHCCDGAKFKSQIRFYVRWGVRIYRDGHLVFSHDLDLSGKDVLIVSCSKALGDNIAWIPLAEEFRQKFGCKVGIACDDKYMLLMACCYPNVDFFDYDFADRIVPYAKYLLGINFSWDWKIQKRSIYMTSLQRCIACDIGLDDIGDIVPKVSLSTPFKSECKYVCISFRASMKMKEWNNEDGKRELVDFLKLSGYRVLCIDADESGDLYGAEDFRGNRPLSERASMLKDCELFIGLPSGLSWLAYACGCIVVMISGFCDPGSDIPNAIRIQNTSVCHGCWNDIRHTADGDFQECPMHMDFQCTKKISSAMVIKKVSELLGVN